MKNINEYTKEIYFINLDNAKKRHELMCQNFKKHNVEAKRFPAIKGSDVNQEQMTKEGYVAKKMPSGNLGCMLSHIGVWDLIKKSNENFGLIFEDDIELDEKFHEKFSKYFEQVPSDWDMVWLASGENLSGEKITNFILKGYNRPGKKKNSWNNGLYAYLIKKQSIDKIKKTILPMQSQHIDWAVRQNLNKTIKGYFFIDYIVKHNYQLHSNRQNVNKTKTKPLPKNNVKKPNNPQKSISPINFRNK